MPNIYLRPISLVYGDDARDLIASGRAGALGGLKHIGFSQVEVISRRGKAIDREFKSFHDLKDHLLINEITRPRGMFGPVELSNVRVMGIVNVTPDSFSDGGQNDETDKAIVRGHRLVEEGADILDIGGESTRPGSLVVSLTAERQRIMPVISVLAKDHIVSVDTRKAALMTEAAAVGAQIINDVSALGFDEKSTGAVAAAGVAVILMHAQGEPRTMQLAPKYDEVALDIYDWLAARIELAMQAGISKSRICIDPGIGFGKTLQHNLEIMRHLTLFHGLGVGLLVGLSRKNMVGVLTGEKVASQRVAGSVGGALQAAMLGAHILRVHDVKETVDGLAVFQGALDPASIDV